ncbi:helix-turn-helix domain-containing protein [Streptomyces xinghaiensis]|uniref:helix-turn-helix domain-containing protein n=1 Tax=Streptomyces xinghaiensis TaxID=1038928 RepID=UPI00344A8B7D
MSVTEFSTESVAAPERFALFEEAAARSHLLNRIHSDQHEDFRARMRILHLNDLQLSALAYPQIQVVRTAKLIRQSDPEVYQVNCVINGTGGAAQAGNVSALSAGQIVVIDSSTPYEIELQAAPDQMSSIVVYIPRSLLPLPRHKLQHLFAVPITSNQGFGAVFSHWLNDLNTRAHEFTPADIPTLTTVTIDLLTSFLSRLLADEDALPPEARNRVLLEKIHEFINRHLSDPSLSTEVIASAHQVSVRQLHRLFAEGDTTPAAWIRQRRLERCRRDLTDPRLGTRPIHSIAARWGFSDPAHFSRVFRTAYGLSPRDYRQHALQTCARQKSTSLWQE